MVAASSTVRPQKSHADYLLLALVAALVIVGLQAVYSATFALSITEHNNVLYFLLRQGLWAAIGTVLLLVFMAIDYRWWKLASPVLLVLAVASLVLVLTPQFGFSQYGASRWLRLGPLPPTQPSEFVKLAVVLGLATWLSRPRQRTQGLLAGLFPVAAGLGVITLLIMKQPDLGTALVILLTAGTMYFLSGASLQSLTILACSGMAGAVLLVSSAAYRVTRWESFLDPWGDPEGKGFHIIQLLIALGSGGIWGLGVGASRQKFFYVPGAHTDGIFAIIGEEMGFVGSVAVILLFAAVVYRGARIIQRAPDAFGSLLAAGIVSWITYQTLINIGGITRAIPLTGIPLPFVSYGGSSLAATMAAIGILLSISRYARNPELSGTGTPEDR